MSEPKRYALKVNEENDFDLIEHSNGEYVRYEDYARLEHVVNYWKVEAETDNARWLRVLEENDRLKAEVERLTKSGEMSGNNLKRCNCQECEDARKELRDRIALKKGGQP